MSTTPKYFMYFPGNYRWSAAFVNMLGRGAYGGADISELHKIGRLLDGKGAEDDDSWFHACVKVADEVRGHAERFQAEGHPVSAAAFYLRACHYYQMGERFRTPKDKIALDAYRTGVDCFHQFAGLTDTKIEIVEVPFEGKSLPGYFVHAQNKKSARAPCVAGPEATAARAADLSCGTVSMPAGRRCARRCPAGTRGCPASSTIALNRSPGCGRISSSTCGW